MPFYRNILKQAWQLTWRHKYLWWFGIFAALLGNGGELEIIFNNSGDPSQSIFPAWQSIISTGIFSRQTLFNIGNLFQHDALNLIFVLVVGLIILAILLLLVWLVMVSQAAIVNNSAAIVKQQKPSLKDGWNSGLLNFWPVLILNVIVKAAVYILLIVISLPLFFFPLSFGANLFYVSALMVVMLLAVILSFIIKYAIAYVVINKFRIGRALEQSWQLFKENWLVSFEMAILLFFINFVVGLAMILAILTLAVPFLFLGIIFYYALSVVGAWFIAFLAFACFLFLIVVCGAALAVFQISSWTSLFLELYKNGGKSKLVRMVNNLVKS
jgi:hypothetical protein